MRSDLPLTVTGVALAVPEALLGANTVAGRRVDAVTIAVELAAVLGAVLLGAGVGGLVRRRAVTRRGIGVATVIALALGVGGWVLTVMFPPPFVTALAPAGTPTANGVLNAVYALLVVGAGAAAIRSTVEYVRWGQRTSEA